MKFSLLLTKKNILHAPHQTSKTSCLLALCDYLNKEDKYHCAYANFETAQTAINNIEANKAIKTVKAVKAKALEQTSIYSYNATQRNRM